MVAYNKNKYILVILIIIKNIITVTTPAFPCRNESKIAVGAPGTTQSF
jgi:hypothetical protein